MYNSFPNWGYVFYAKNEREETLFYYKDFKQSKNAGYVAHTFYSLLNNKGWYDYGYGQEKPEWMQEAGVLY